MILLDVPKDVQRGRLIEREGGPARRVEGMVGCREEWKGVRIWGLSSGEVTLTVTQDMTKDEVAQAVLATVH